MEELLFSLNATVPVFLLMAMGYILKRLHVLEGSFLAALNRFTYNVTLPFMMYANLAVIDFRTLWDGSYILLCMTVTLLCFGTTALISVPAVAKNRALRGEFIQGSFRGSAVLLAFAYVQNLYGRVTVTSLMVLGTVPLYNLVSAVILSLTMPQTNGEERSVVQETLQNLIKNPVLIGIALGLMGSVFQVQFPAAIDKTISNVAALTAPLALMCLGASFEPGDMRRGLRLTVLGTVVKLLLLPLIFLPPAIFLGLSGEKMAAYLIMVGSPTSVTSYVMAKNTGHAGVLTAGLVALTTLMSTFSITWWIYLLRTLNSL